MSDPDLVGTLVAERFRMIRRIGGGSFGEIYMGMGPNLTEVYFKENVQIAGIIVRICRPSRCR
jgi:hypothetical protein